MKASSRLGRGQRYHALLDQQHVRITMERRAITLWNPERRLNGHSIYVEIEDERAALIVTLTSLAPRGKRSDACISRREPS